MKSIHSEYSIKQSLLIWGVGDLYFILAVMITLLFAVVAPDIQQQLHLSNLELGFLGTAFFLCYGIAQLFAGRLLDIFGPKLTLSFSAVLAALGLWLMSATHSFVMATIAKVIIGIGLSTSYIGAIYLARICFPENRFALMSGITQASANIMTALLIVLMALVSAFHNFRPLITYLGVLVFLVALLMIIFIKKNDSEVSLTEKRNFTTELCSLLSIKQYWLSVLYFSVSFGSLLCLADLWNIPTQIAYHHTIKTAAMINAMFPLGGGIGSVTAAWLAQQKQCPATIAKYFMSGMLLVALVYIYGPNLSVKSIVLILVMLGFLFGGAVLAFPIVSKIVDKQSQGLAFGFMTMCAYLLSALLQYVIGLILGEARGIQQISHFKWALTPILIVLLIAWVSSFWLKDKKRAG